MAVIFSFCLGRATALKIVLCDCSKVSLVASVHLTRYSSCDMESVPMSTRVANYSVFEHWALTRKFTGFACRAWKRGVEVKTFWTLSTDTVNYDNPAPLSPPECWGLVQRRNCDGKQMVKDGDAWRYEALPSAVWPWLRTVKAEIMNCFYEEDLSFTTKGQKMFYQ